MTSTKTPIAVTGGSGYLGSHCVQQLLEKGYTVHATTRKLEKAEHLKQLKHADTNLKIFVADLLTPGSFDEAFNGCESVLHTASPFFVGGDNYQKDILLKPALDGTRNVLEACRKANVKRVALTASTACVYVWYGKYDETHVMTEADWSDEEAVVKDENWYTHSKIEAEKFAWEFSKRDDCTFKLSVMNPCLIVGPMLQPVLNTSCKVICNFVGMNEIANECKAFVDVRDVAEAHVNQIEKDLNDESWGKRYCLVGGSPHFKEVAGWVKTYLSENDMGAAAEKVPTTVSSKLNPPKLGAPPPHPLKYDVSRSETLLGIKYKPVEESIRSNVASLIELGFLKK